MALAFDPNRTYFRGINKYKQFKLSLYWNLAKGTTAKAQGITAITMDALG